MTSLFASFFRRAWDSPQQAGNPSVATRLTYTPAADPVQSPANAVNRASACTEICSTPVTPPHVKRSKVKNH